MAYIGSKPANKPVVASDLDPTVITGQTALAVAPADTDEFLISDAGVLKRLDASLIGGTNTPAFFAYLSSNQTSIANATHTLVTFNAENFDTGNGFNTGTHKFTVPETGKYFIGIQVRKSDFSSSRMLVTLEKNGNTLKDFEGGTHSAYGAVVGHTLESLSANDVLQVKLYQVSGGSQTIRGGSDSADTFFFGYKIIE